MNERLAARPLDPKRQLPVPYVQIVRPDGVADFTGLSGEVSDECGRLRLCGLCGLDIGYWVAFVGGPQSVRTRSFGDPPMCVDCAVDAITLCPHIARQRVPRRPEGVTPDGRPLVVPDGWVEDKPARWGVYVTRRYVMKHRSHPQGGYTIIFKPAPPKEVRWFAYDDGGRIRSDGVTR